MQSSNKQICVKVNERAEHKALQTYRGAPWGSNKSLPVPEPLRKGKYEVE